MVVQEVPRELRLEMATKARSSKTRITGFSRELPVDWNPYTVISPFTGLPYTDQSAWDLIADLLEDQTCKAEFITLDKPAGKKAVVIIHALQQTKQPLYIKVHMERDKVIGRSFHYSTKSNSK
jgi:hypothetical protein